MPLHHIVLFKLAGDLDASGAAFDPLMRTLLDTAPGVLTQQFETDLGLRPGSPRAYNRMIHLTFPGPDEFKHYLACDEHQLFLGEIKEIVETIASVQYDGA